MHHTMLSWRQWMCSKWREKNLISSKLVLVETRVDLSFVVTMRPPMGEKQIWSEVNRARVDKREKNEIFFLFGRSLTRPLLPARSLPLCIQLLSRNHISASSDLCVLFRATNISTLKINLKEETRRAIYTNSEIWFIVSILIEWKCSHLHVNPFLRHCYCGAGTSFCGNVRLWSRAFEYSVFDSSPCCLVL